MSPSKRIVNRLQEPAVRAVAASATVAAGGALAAKLAHDHRGATVRPTRRTYRLEPRESPRAGTARVVQGQLDRAVRGLREDQAHDARKALKRVRAAVRLNRHLLGPEQFRRLNRAFRDAGRSAAGARDAEALIEALDRLIGQAGDGLPADPWGRFRGALLHDLSAATEAARNGGVPDAVAARLGQARDEVATWPLPDSGGPGQLATGLKRIYRQGRRAARVARAEPTVENLHELRKRSKDLWHGAQLLRCSAPKRARRLARRARRLADLLGEDHDLALLRQRAEREPALLDAGELELLTQLIDRRRNRLREEALGCAKRLYRRKPGKLVRRLGLAASATG